MNGVILLNKPKGFTSHDCVAKLRGILKTKKVGHTGTLDPDTTGLLPICINKATKIVPYLTAENKEYICRIRIGYSTTSEDQSGDVVDSLNVNKIPLESIDDVLSKLLEIKEQTPPMYSAVKINGKKLYEYARQGITIDRPSRKISIMHIERLSDPVYSNSCVEFDFKIRGSKGFYVRTICVTIGEMLGYPAHMAELNRTMSGSFKLEDSYTFEEIESGNFKVISIKDALPMKSIELDKINSFRVMNGAAIENIYDITEPTLLCSRVPLAIYAPHPDKPGMIKPLKVL